MPIEVTCGSCNRRLRVPDKTAGKKIKCPKCQGVIQVPDTAPAEAAVPAMAATQAAAEAWYVKTDDGEDYGPVGRGELDQWAAEGRLNADCQLLLEGGEQWQWASDVYPDLDPKTASAGAGVQHSGDASMHEEVSDKKKIVAGLLGIFLGSLGVHRFYLGYTGIGIAQIAVTICTCGIGGWWGIIEGIMILLGSMDRDADGRKLAE